MTTFQTISHRWKNTIIRNISGLKFGVIPHGRRVFIKIQTCKALIREWILKWGKYKFMMKSRQIAALRILFLLSVIQRGKTLINHLGNYSMIIIWWVYHNLLKLAEGSIVISAIATLMEIVVSPTLISSIFNPVRKTMATVENPILFVSTSIESLLRCSFSYTFENYVLIDINFRLFYRFAWLRYDTGMRDVKNRRKGVLSRKIQQRQFWARLWVQRFRLQSFG